MLAACAAPEVLFFLCLGVLRRFPSEGYTFPIKPVISQSSGNRVPESAPSSPQPPALGLPDRAPPRPPVLFPSLRPLTPVGPAGPARSSLRQEATASPSAKQTLLSTSFVSISGGGKQHLNPVTDGA